MREQRIGFLPVRDPAGRPLGVVTDRDLALRLCAENRSAEHTPVSEVMTRDPVRCPATYSVEQAEALMLERKTRRILLVDEQDRLVGLITLADVVHHQDAFKMSRFVRQLTQKRFRLER